MDNQFIQPKPKMKIRDTLTSIQINDHQKQIIDQAYQVFHNSNDEHLTKGEFLTLVAVDYIRKNSLEQVK